MFEKLTDNQFYSRIYLLYAVPLTIFLAFNIPSFQVPDEGGHYQRAYQVAEGEFFPQKRVNPSEPEEFSLGGSSSSNIYHVEGLYLHIAFKPDAKIDPEVSRAAKKIKWDETRWADTRNVSIYPPIFYFPSSLGIMLGKAVDISVSDTLILSRLLSGLMAVLLAFAAIYITKRGSSVLFCILVLPMTIAQMASVSQDSIGFSLAALCAAYFSKLESQESANNNITLFSACSLLILISMARPPYVALSLLFLVFSLLHWRSREIRLKLIVSFFSSFILVALWSIYLTVNVSVPFGPEGVSYALQAKEMLNGPLQFAGLFINSWMTNYDFYFLSFIGKLGYLDVNMPKWYYWFAALSIIFAIGPMKSSYREESGKLVRWRMLLIVLVLLFTIVGLFLVLNISWTPVGSLTIHGVQGRYFIPVAFFLSLIAGFTDKPNLGVKLQRGILSTFAVATFLVIPFAVMNRYY